ncbi:MAG: response regulator [Candidatus Cloacimonetes bacterium]|nr:response regulator [Candidatus Cloacimonadota bacterium]
MRILNVDDNSDNLLLLQSLLGTNDNTFFDAKNGREALKILAEQEIDLVISDILMPIMDGFTLCKEIRSNPKLHNIPFIVFTATYTGQKDEVLARKMGADDFIVKPCEPDELVRRIDKTIKHQNSRNRLEDIQTYNDETVLKLYNERLVRKLEDKMLETENEVLERKKAIVALQRSEGILKATQSLGKLGGWEIDMQNGEVYWTEEMYRLHDIEPGSISGDDLIAASLEGYPEESRLKLQEYFQTIREKGTAYTLESWFTTQKNRKIYIRTSAIAKMENGKTTHILGIFQDISEQKNAEIKHQELMQQLRQAQKLDSIGQLAGGVAHDFNNILTVILGYSEEILNTLHQRDPIRQDIQEIASAGQRAATLTRQLLTFSRKQVIKPQLMNINEAIGNLSKMLKRLIGEDIDFVLDLGTNVPEFMADVGQIEQVIMNLVINAREAMQMGGTLTIKTFGYTADDSFCSKHPMISGKHFAVLRICDTGSGMDKETMEHIFEPFFTTKAKGHGTGLGLPTVYGIVRQAGGNIHVESTPGKGASFVILLPATEQSLETPTAPTVPTHTTGNKELVLVVEDDPAISDLSGKIIQKMGFSVKLASSADQALVMIEDEGLRPKLVISDVVMPGLSGIELAAIIKFKHPEMKFLLMSGYTETVIAKHGDVDPKIPFLHKPFTHQELLHKIEQALET